MKSKILIFIKQYIIFGFFSGLGLLIDISIFYISTKIFGNSVLYSNIFSAFCGVSFVYLVSTRMVFYKKKLPVLNYIFYLVYQIAAILFFSFLIKTVDLLIFQNPLYSKISVLPFTLTLNYFAMKNIINIKTDL